MTERSDHYGPSKCIRSKKLFDSDCQEEQMAATNHAVQALVSQVSELTTQLQRLQAKSVQQPTASNLPVSSVPDQAGRFSEPRLPPPAFYSGEPQLCRSFLAKCSLYISLQPSSFPTEESKSVPFLGYSVSVEGLRMDPDKIQAVGRLANSRFLQGPAETALTSTKTLFRWSSAAKAEFAKLKSCFVSAPILITPDPFRQFVVEVDASEVGVSAVLSQHSSLDSKMHPCVYFSHRLSPAERNYDIGNGELLAVKLALEEWFTWEIESKVRTASQGVTPLPGCPPGLPPSSGNTVVLTVVEWFSKATHFIALPKLPSARETAVAVIDHVFHIHGLPTDVVSDRGPQFVSKFWRKFCHLLEATVSLSSGLHPQSNGQTERANQDLERMLRCLVSQNPSSLSQQLSWVEYAHNSLPVSAMGLSPFECSLGYQPPIFSSLESEVAVPSAHAFVQRCRRAWNRARQTLMKVGARTKAKADHHRSKPPVYVISQKVWLSSKNIPLRTVCNELAHQRCLVTAPDKLVRVLTAITLSSFLHSCKPGQYLYAAITRTPSLTPTLT
ncbi:Transposon Ty3-I Gag-Pol polyprotein [Labeo rohita]|uniref:Transposon Ty3-I Gag-Pol polyprotein n=1 Tax=Labeo rohita TaxID=84645 RepID=A0ABQ8LWI9_LABRO|nr:Transposon Ty3-I Gag-Pol polyprotein [Labeo rohita]